MRIVILMPLLMFHSLLFRMHFSFVQLASIFAFGCLLWFLLAAQHINVQRTNENERKACNRDSKIYTHTSTEAHINTRMKNRCGQAPSFKNLNNNNNDNKRLQAPMREQKQPRVTEQGADKIAIFVSRCSCILFVRACFRNDNNHSSIGLARFFIYYGHGSSPSLHAHSLARSLTQSASSSFRIFKPLCFYLFLCVYFIHALLSLLFCC